MARSEPSKSKSELNASNIPPPITGGWVRFSTPEGKFYYHNKQTGVTQWDKPADFADSPISSPINSPTTVHKSKSLFVLD